MFVLLQEEISSYSIDWDGPIPSDSSNSDDCMHVEVPDIQVSLDDEQQQHFIGLLDPLGDSDCYGIDLYICARNSLQSLG